ncbi:hypothetical protein D3C73_1546640 [compost metagenome]
MGKIQSVSEILRNAKSAKFLLRFQRAPTIDYCRSHLGAIAGEQNIYLPAGEVEARLATLMGIQIDALKLQGILAELFK